MPTIKEIKNQLSNKNISVQELYNDYYDKAKKSKLNSFNHLVDPEYNKENIKEILLNYSIGQLKEFKGIEDGIENTNYFLLVGIKKYILTIYEKRAKENDLPFYSDLMTGLDKVGFKCPTPIQNNNNETITR